MLQNDAIVRSDQFLFITPPTRIQVASTSPAKETSELTKQSAATTIPTMVRGDWVLFHPVYNKDEVKAVKVRLNLIALIKAKSSNFQVLHRKRLNFSDSVAYGLVKLARVLFDKISGYKHMKTPPDPNMSLYELRKAGYLLDDKGWLSVSLVFICLTSALK